ncbi:MAG TPA: CPBP family intramembrane glutamic endopeptidase [Candidatus Solibacter sp.]|nr:CPBP family intramembrane glutamic endopeptidase [Candidatus Solibacter sp.]
MKKRLPYILLLAAALVAWWVSDHEIVPWVQRVTGYKLIKDRDVSVLLGHWVIDQLPRVIVCVAVWLLGSRYDLMPSLRRSFASAGSWRRVVRTGLIATAILLVVTVGIGAAAGGTFGFHPYFPKMAGDLVSNMYEEIVYRGLMFCAFYGVAASASFPLAGKADRVGLVVGTIGSCFVFAAGHEQYSLPLRVVVGLVAVLFAYPWISARSLWAPWIPHTLGDVIGDTILKL